MTNGADLEARVTALLAEREYRGAATEVIRGYGPRALGYLHRLLGNDADASDAFSMFAEQVWRGMPNFEGRSSVKTWAFKAAWSAAMKIRDDAWRRLREGLPSSAASHLADGLEGIPEVYCKNLNRLTHRQIHAKTVERVPPLSQSIPLPGLGDSHILPAVHHVAMDEHIMDDILQRLDTVAGPGGNCNGAVMGKCVPSAGITSVSRD